MNIETAIRNLSLLHAHPDLNSISVDPDGRLIETPISLKMQRDLLEIINQTFAFAENYEAQKHMPLCVKGETQEGKRVSYSAGRVLGSLRPPKDVSLPQRALVDEVHPLVSITCADSVVYEVDVEILKRSSTYFRNLFGPHFQEGTTLTAHVACSSEAFEILLRFFEGTPLPPTDANITDLVYMAGLLLNEDLNHALIQQLVLADNLDGQSWGILYGVNEFFFRSMLKAVSNEKKIKILSDFFLSYTTPPPEQVTSGRDPLALKALRDFLQDEEGWDAIRGILLAGKVFDVDFQKSLANFIYNKEIIISNLNWGAIGTILQQTKLVDLGFRRIVDLINDKEIKFSFFSYDLEFKLLSPEDFSQIQVLDLKDTKLNDAQIAALICKCQGLSRLALPTTSRLNLDDYLKYTPLLTHLDLSNCTHLPERCLDGLKYVRGLKHLDIRRCKRLDFLCLKNLREVPCLEYFGIEDCDNLDPQCLENLRYVPALERLTIFYCKEIDWNCLGNLQHVPGLKRLDMRHFRGDNPFSHFPGDSSFSAKSCLENLRHVPNLTHLNIGSCYWLAITCLENLQHVLHLQYLNIRGCKRLAKTCLENLRHVPHLEYLNISDCDQFCLASMQNLCHVRGLKKLVCSLCPQIDRKDLERLKSDLGMDELSIEWEKIE